MNIEKRVQKLESITRANDPTRPTIMAPEPIADMQEWSRRACAEMEAYDRGEPYAPTPMHPLKFRRRQQ